VAAGGQSSGEAGGKQTGGARPPNKFQEAIVSSSATLTITQMFMSFLHAWGLDPDLDRLCLNKLGLLCPRRPISFGLVTQMLIDRY